MSSTIVQYILVRGDLLLKQGWNVGSVMAQGCHAATAAIHLHYTDEDTQKYLEDLDNMHKVVLEAPDQEALQKAADKLTESEVKFKLWVEQPENFPTCLALKPYPKQDVQKYFKKFKLYKGPELSIKDTKESEKVKPAKEASKKEEADYNPDSKLMRKLFVGGLGPSTTEEQLKDYFEQFGLVLDIVIMKFPDSGKSRGFGFITFEKGEMVDSCQKARPHKLKGRTIETKRATPRSESGKLETQYTVQKIYVEGLRDDISDADLKEHFAQFGNVTNVNQILWNDTGKKRGFGYVEFDDHDAVDKVILVPDHTVKGRKLYSKKALSKTQMEMVKKAREGQEENDNWGNSHYGGGMGAMGRMGMDHSMGNLCMGMENINMGNRMRQMASMGMGNGMNMGNGNMGYMGMGNGMNMGNRNMGNMGMSNSQFFEERKNRNMAMANMGRMNNMMGNMANSHMGRR